MGPYCMDAGPWPLHASRIGVPPYIKKLEEALGQFLGPDHMQLRCAPNRRTGSRCRPLRFECDARGRRQVYALLQVRDEGRRGDRPVDTASERDGIPAPIEQVMPRAACAQKLRSSQPTQQRGLPRQGHNVELDSRTVIGLGMKVGGGTWPSLSGGQYARRGASPGECGRYRVSRTVTHAWQFSTVL